MSRIIRPPTPDVSKVRKCPLGGLGALSGREMGADSRTQSPGELCQTRLQDTNTSSQSKQSCSHSLIHIHAYFREWKMANTAVHMYKSHAGGGALRFPLKHFSNSSTCVYPGLFPLHGANVQSTNFLKAVEAVERYLRITTDDTEIYNETLNEHVKVRRS